MTDTHTYSLKHMKPYEKAIIIRLIQSLENTIAANLEQPYPSGILKEYSLEEFDGSTGQYLPLQAAMQRKLLRKGILLNQYAYNPDITVDELIAQLQSTIAYIEGSANYSRFMAPSCNTSPTTTASQSGGLCPTALQFKDLVPTEKYFEVENPGKPWSSEQRDAINTILEQLGNLHTLNSLDPKVSTDDIKSIKVSIRYL